MNLLSNIKNKISDDKIIPLKIIHAWYHWNRKDIHAIKKSVSGMKILKYDVNN